jgi:hypothetical protein
MQVRVVRVVMRSERARMTRWGVASAQRARFLGTLKSRSLEVLDATRARLNGNERRHSQLIREIELARAEVTALF